MNILFLDSVDRQTFGGYQNWISLLAPALKKKGYDITVAGRPDSSFIRRLRAQQPTPRIMEIAISGDFNPATIYRINRYLDEAAIDIIICDFNKDVRLGGLAARMNGRTKVLWRMGLNITKNNFIHRFLTPILIDAVAVPSEGLKKQVIESEYISTEDLSFFISLKGSAFLLSMISSAIASASPPIANAASSTCLGAVFILIFFEDHIPRYLRADSFLLSLNIVGIARVSVSISELCKSFI